MSLPSSLNKIQKVLLFAALLVLPFQLGKHFWPPFSYVAGQRVDYLSPTIYISDIFIALLFLASVVMSFLRRQESRFRIKSGMTNKKTPFWLGILLFLSLNIFFSLSPANGWYFLLKILEFTFFGWFIASQKKEIGSMLFKTFFIGILLESVLGILQFFHQGSLGGLWYFLGERSFSSTTPGIANASIHGQLVLRPYATFPHPNVFAGYLVIALLFLLIWIFTTKSRLQKILSIPIILLGSIALLFTLSRVALVVFLCLSIILLLVKFSKHKLWILLMSFGLFLSIFFSNALFSGRFFDSSSYDESFALRDVLMQTSFSMIRGHLFFGVGLGNFLATLPYYLPEKVLFGFLQPVHNIFLLVFVETGIIGFGVFAWILLQALFASFSGWKVKHDHLSLFAFLGLIAICAIGMTDHYFLTLQQGELLLTLILGISFANNKPQSTRRFGEASPLGENLK